MPAWFWRLYDRHPLLASELAALPLALVVGFASFLVDGGWRWF